MFETTNQLVTSCYLQLSFLKWPPWHYLSGWWLTYPSEKYYSVGKDYPISYMMENKKCLKPPTSCFACHFPLPTSEHVLRRGASSPFHSLGLSCHLVTWCRPDHIFMVITLVISPTSRDVIWCNWCNPCNYMFIYPVITSKWNYTPK